MLGKICGSGLKEITVPFSWVRSSFASFPKGIPLEYSWEYFQPPLRTSARRCSERPFTTEPPTPCSPAGYFVSAAAELAPGVQCGHDGFQGSLAGRGMYVHRDTAPVIGDRNKPFGIQRDRNRGTKPGHRLIHGIVQNFVDQMMQAPLIGTANGTSRAGRELLPVLPGPGYLSRYIRGVACSCIIIRRHKNSVKVRESSLSKKTARQGGADPLALCLLYQN